MILIFSADAPVLPLSSVPTPTAMTIHASNTPKTHASTPKTATVARSTVLQLADVPTLDHLREQAIAEQNPDEPRKKAYSLPEAQASSATALAGPAPTEMQFRASYGGTPFFIKKALTHDPAALKLAKELSRISDPYVLSDLTEDFRGNRRSVLLVRSCFDKDNKIVGDTMVFCSGGVPVPLPRP